MGGDYLCGDGGRHVFRLGGYAGSNPDGEPGPIDPDPRRADRPRRNLRRQFTDETGKNIGPYNANYPTFHILSFGGGLAPNTPITLTITTYTGPGLTGSVTFTSGVTFNCTTGAIILAPAGTSVVGHEIPALSTGMLLALIGLSGMLGAAALRRRGRDADQV